jgi:hypothetical protein
MRRNSFRLARSLQHKQLWQNGDTFQPDGESPQYLDKRVPVGEEDCEKSGTGYQILHFKGILVGVMSGLEVVQHKVDYVGGRADEDDLEDGVVERGWIIECPQ